MTPSFRRLRGALRQNFAKPVFPTLQGCAISFIIIGVIIPFVHVRCRGLASMALDAAGNLRWNVEPFHFGLEKMPDAMKHHFFSSIGCFNAQGFARGCQFIGYGVSVKRDPQFRRGREDERAVSGFSYCLSEQFLGKRRQGHDVQVVLILIPGRAGCARRGGPVPSPINSLFRAAAI